MNVYRTYEEWMQEEPSYSLEGDMEIWRDGLVLMKTYEKSRRYQQIFSACQVFAITYPLPSGFMMYYDDIHFYKTYTSWENGTPEVSLQGQMCLEESTNQYVTIITRDGYKQIIFMKDFFAVTHERK